MAYVRVFYKVNLNTRTYPFYEYHCFSFLQLREYQQRNSPGVPAGAKKKKKIKNDNNPETTTAGDCNSPEDVSLGWPGLQGQRAQRVAEDNG
jgi:hypothetical protein